MNDAIQQIINQLPTGAVFDAHFIISQLIKHYSDEYIHFSSPEQTTAQMHGKIAQQLRSIANISKLDYTSYSENIHGVPSPCTLWQID